MMKKYIEKDLETFERDEWGWLICPSGDYTEIRVFPAKCTFDAFSRFGEECSFDRGCSFGAWSRFGELSSFGDGSSHEGLTNSIYVAVDRIGSEMRKTYFFKAKEGYFVRAGCFFGTLDEFKAQVYKTHRGTIHEQTYLMACDLAVKLLDSQWK